MSQVTMTTTTQPVTVVCFGASLIAIMVTPAPTSVGQMTLGQQNVVLGAQLILRDSVRGSADLTHLLQQPHTQSQISFQAYANYAMGPLQLSFSYLV